MVRSLVRLAALTFVLPSIGRAVSSGESGGSAAQQGGQGTTRERVRSAVESAARAVVGEPRAAGVSIGVMKDGETFTYHFGRLERGREAPPNDRTLYAIASITKTFTGTLLAQAALEKKVRLDADVRTYLAGDYPGLEFQDQPIVLPQLLNHRSGLPFVLPDTTPDKANEVLRGQTRSVFFEHLRRVKLDGAPGKAFRYSNAGAQLVGYILEDIYGLSYEELLKQRITQPLGMVDTAIVLTAAQRARLAKGYDGEGGITPDIPDEFQGAAALKSTVADMLKYTRWQVAEEDPAVRLSHVATLTEGNYSAGLNWQMLASDGRRLIWQEGHVPGFLSYCVALPELGLGLVVLTNAEDATASSRVASMANQILSVLDPRSIALP